MSKVKKILLFLFISLFFECFIFYKPVIADSFPGNSADSFIVIERETGRILASKNADKKKYMASTTKIMTGILAIEKLGNINKIVTVPKECTNIEGSSMYLTPDKKIKYIDLLYGLMLRSGNDAATTIAYYAGGENVDKFVEDMNKKAKQIGAYNTNFTNPHGLHNDNHYTTAYDLALISRYAMNNPTFREIVEAKKYNNSDNNVFLINKNKVVYEYKYGNGIKIGYTKKAGRCLVASAKKGDTEIIVVLLGDGNWFNDSYNVFNFVFDKYNYHNIVSKGQIMYYDSNNRPIYAENGFKYILSGNEMSMVKIETKKTIDLLSSDNKNIICGIYKVYLGDRLLHCGNLIY